MASLAALVDAAPLPVPVSADSDDDKFLAAALAASAPLIVSGDRDLLEISKWQVSGCSRLERLRTSCLAKTDRGTSRRC
jgi:predicted nucleic acid-binding protein